ncbi:ABC transporter ATP-binding protein [Natronospirillum operosum]|uniref:ABC-type dipeptide transporter n=2 Tax=Natronospirillum operosum TaxID=2759953 RepID=A0A4Z0WBX5_9GAMM|nr:ABC transporter ATP-binding protein [Natronospirillum operosum]
MSSVLRVADLSVTFKSEDGPVYAVSDVNFALNTGETLALLGESGCGKSVTLKSLMRLHPPHKTTLSGQIEITGDDVVAMSQRRLSALRGKRVAMIFQEPMLAFDPVFTIGQQITETVRRHTGCARARARARALEMLEMVRIPSAASRLDAYPHEMSGGMRQRAMIALALSCQPDLLLADEPTTALDATVQIQVLKLLRELQTELGMSMIIVTHDVGVAIEVADRVAVMYAGRIIEEGPVNEVLSTPQHPYTQGLLAATVHPGMDRAARLTAIPGAPPRLTRRLEACAFAPRCYKAGPECRQSIPRPSAVAPAEPGADSSQLRMVSCYRPGLKEDPRAHESNQ